MESTADIVQRLSDPTVGYSDKKYLVTRLRNLALANKGIIFIASLTKLFHTLELLLQLDKSDTQLPELSIQVVELLNILVSNTDPETEIFLTKFLSTLIPCLATQSAALRKNIIGYISRYLTKTSNYEAVFAAVNRLGLESPDRRLRISVLDAVESWWKTAATSNMGNILSTLSEARKLLQNVVQRLKDPSEIVQKAAQNVLVSMTTTLPKTTSILAQKLPPAQLSAYSDLMVEEHIEQYHKSAEEVSPTVDLLDEDVKQAFSFAHSKPQQEPLEWPEMDGLVFGVVPDCIVNDLSPTANWKERAAAIDDLKEIISVPSNIAKLEMYFSSFFKFIVRLLSDSNYKVSVFNLLNEKKKVLSSKTNLNVLVPGLVEKLGDNKIVIRQLAQEALKVLSESIKHGVLLGILIPYLDSPNWHTREEILTFIIRLFLRCGSNKGELGSLEDIDYATLINAVARLLDDEKPKVVQIVYEAIATVAQLGDRTKVLELLLEVVDQEVYRKLCDRIEAGALPVLRTEGGLEFPYLTSGLTTQNSFYASAQGGFRSSTNSMLTSAKTGDNGSIKERFTSAGPIKLNKSNYNNDTPEKKPQTEQPITMRSGSVENKLAHLKGPTSLKKYTRTSLAGKLQPETEPMPFNVAPKRSSEVGLPKPRPAELDKTRHSPTKFSKAEESDHYLTLEQLLPLDNPEEAVKKSAEDLKSSDWSKQFDACNTLRRACAHHSEVLTHKSAGPIHGIVVDLVKIAESLRSSLVKNCVLAFTEIDMVRTLRRGLDLELEGIVGTLIKKGLETGSFLAVHVNELLEAICESCSENRISAALLSVLGAHKSLSSISNPSPAVKLRAIICLERLIHRLGNRLVSFKDGEKIMSVLTLFLSEGSLEVRSAAKRAIISASSKAMSPIEFDRLLQRALNESGYEKVKKLLSKEGTNDSPFLHGKHVLSNKRLKPTAPVMKQEEDRKSPTYSPSAHKPQFAKARPLLSPAEEPGEFENIPAWTTTVNTSNNWKLRVDAIDSLMKIAEKFPDLLGRSGKFISVLDALAKTLNDTNVKVSLKAVATLERFIPLFKTNLEQNLTLILGCLATNLCSTNISLKNKADVLIDLLIDTLENTCLIQPFVHIALYGNPRAKPNIILHLCDILPEVYKQKPGLITKHVYPAAFKLLDDTKIEIKSAVNKLIQTLYGLVGTALLEVAPQQKASRILEAVKI